MDQLSQALNLGAQRMPSAYSPLQRLTLKKPPEKADCIYTVSIHLPNLGVELGCFKGAFQGQKSPFWMIYGAIALTGCQVLAVFLFQANSIHYRQGLMIIRRF